MRCTQYCLLFGALVLLHPNDNTVFFYSSNVLAHAERLCPNASTAYSTLLSNFSSDVGFDECENVSRNPFLLSNLHDSLHTALASDSIDEILWNRFLNDQLNACDIDIVVLISDTTKVEFYFSRTFNQFNFPLQVLHVTNDSLYSDYWTEWLRDEYVEHGIKTFLIASENPEFFLNVADDVFRAESHGPTAAMPHQTQWIVYVWTREQMEAVVTQQTYSPLDNVVVVFVNISESRPFFALKVNAVLNFMWRENRNKETAIVDLKSISDNDENKCSIFPNKAFGFNGRELIVFAKTFLDTFLSILPSTNGTGSTYKGLLRDILDYSSKELNFTYSYVPNVEDSEGMTWAEYSKLLEYGSADIGLSPWSLAYQTTSNMSFSYPVLFDEVTGIYKRRSGRRDDSSFLLLCPFPPEVYLYLLSLMFYVSTVYMIYIRFIYRSHKTHEMRNALICDRRLTHTWDIDRYDGGYFTVDLLSRYVFTIFVFFASILNQSYLPQPRQMSARMLVGLWSAGMVMFYAMFQSYITAEMVKSTEEFPFRTFEELVKRTDYNCGIVNNTITSTFFARASAGSVAGRLRKNVKLLDLSDFQSVDDSINDVLDTMDYKFVMIFQETVLRKWLKHQSVPENYVIMRDVLFRSDMAMVFPPHSDINRLISRKLLDLYESGIHQEYYLRHNGRGPPVDVNTTTAADSKKGKQIDIHYMKGLWFLCGGCITMSSCVLLLEVWLYKKRRAQRSIVAKHARDVVLRRL